MTRHINKHYNDIRLLRLDYCELKEKLVISWQFIYINFAEIH